MGVRSWVTSQLVKALDGSGLQDYIRYAMGGSESSTGILVNPNSAMQSAAVYACVKVLAESIAQLPINLFIDEGVRGKTPNDGDGLLDLLRYQPNDWQTSTDFFEMMAAHLNLRGNAYAYVGRTTRGRVVEIIPLHPDFVNLQVIGTGVSPTFLYQATSANGGMYTFGVDEILHVRGLTLNGYQGISPISYAREAIGLALATEQFGSRLFKNGAKMGGIVAHPGKLSKEAYDRLKETFDSSTSGSNAHKTTVLEEGMKWEKVTMTAEDSQFLETRKHQRSEIASIFRVPPHMIGDLERATFSNIEQQSLEFVTYSLMPWLKRIELAVRRCVFTQKQRDSHLFARFDVNALLRGDSAARNAYITGGINAGWLTRNEARTMEDRNPIDGLDEPLRPLNMVGINEPLAPKAPPAPAPAVPVPAPAKGTLHAIA